jgi:hypothetical protein
MSFFNKIIEGIGDLSGPVIKGLNELRELDKVTHAETSQLSKDEAALLEAVRQAGKQVSILHRVELMIISM